MISRTQDRLLSCFVFDLWHFHQLSSFLLICKILSSCWHTTALLNCCLPFIWTSPNSIFATLSHSSLTSHSSLCLPFLFISLLSLFFNFFIESVQYTDMVRKTFTPHTTSNPFRLWGMAKQQFFSFRILYISFLFFGNRRAINRFSSFGNLQSPHLLSFFEFTLITLFSSFSNWHQSQFFLIRKFSSNLHLKHQYSAKRTRTGCFHFRTIVIINQTLLFNVINSSIKRRLLCFGASVSSV